MRVSAYDIETRPRVLLHELPESAQLHLLRRAYRAMTGRVDAWGHSERLFEVIHTPHPGTIYNPALEDWTSELRRLFVVEQQGAQIAVNWLDQAEALMSLNPALNEVICISVATWKGPEITRLCYSYDEQAEGIVADDLPVEGYYWGTKHDILTRVMGLLGESDMVFGYGSYRFDGPMLMYHAAQAEVEFLDLSPGGYKLIKFIDLVDVLTARGHGYRPTLEQACLAAGLPSPKQSLEGSQVRGAYQEGRIEEILSYCCCDSRATLSLGGKVYLEWAPYFALHSD